MTRSSPSTLGQRREQLRHGLTRSNYAAVGVLVVVVSLAIGEAWEARQAQLTAASERAARLATQQASLEKQQQLWRSQLLEAQSYRISTRPGQRLKSLQVIEQAALWQPSLPLRNEAIAALLLPDLGQPVVWHPGFYGHWPMAYDPTFQHYAPWSEAGDVTVHRVEDDAVVARFNRFGADTQWLQFSPDGELLAVRFANDNFAVWRWRQRRLVLEARSRFLHGNHPVLDFLPDGKHLAVCSLDGPVRRFDLESGREIAPLLPGVVAESIRLSPSGRLVLTAANNEVTVWDSRNGVRKGGCHVSGVVRGLAWHPNEERVAIGTAGDSSEASGLFVWDVGRKEPKRVLDGTSITRVFFSEDGQFLVASGWGDLTTVWDSKELRLLLETKNGFAIQMSRDGRRIAFARERLGYGIWPFFPPVGLKRIIVPQSLDDPVNCVDFDSSGRWLLTGHREGWAAWDTETGRLAASERIGPILRAGFLPGGQDFYTCTPREISTWSLATNGPATLTAVRTPLLVAASESAEHDNASLTRDGKRLAVLAGTRWIIKGLHGTGGDVVLENNNELATYVQFSPDDRWVATGHYHGDGVDVFDALTGRKAATLATGSGAFLFSPRNDLLYSNSPTNYTAWQLGRWQLAREFSWAGEVNVVPVGFSPDGSCMFVTAGDGQLRLHDPRTGQDFAVLHLPWGSAAWEARFDPAGQQMVTRSSRGAINTWRLSEIRTELARLGLDWKDTDPGNGFAPNSRTLPGAPMHGAETGPPPDGRGSPLAAAIKVWLPLAGVVAAILFGLLVLGYQRRLVRNYAEVEALVERRNRELADAEKALVHSQKMKALGTLAAGVAHDFNNLLSVIRMSNQLVERDVRPTGDTRQNIAAIESAVTEGKAIVRSILGYSRTRVQSRACCALQDVVTETVGLLSRQFLSGIVLTLELDPETPSTLIDRAKVEQMLLNILVNAAEAMDGAGRLLVGLQTVIRTPGCLLEPRPAPRYARLWIADSGPGIPFHVLPRIFDPFFTTKTVGAVHGTGLGLAMVYSAAQGESFGIAVETAMGQGTTFILYIPVDEAMPIEPAVG